MGPPVINQVAAQGTSTRRRISGRAIPRPTTTPTAARGTSTASQSTSGSQLRSTEWITDQARATTRTFAIAACAECDRTGDHARDQQPSPVPALDRLSGLEPEAECPGDDGDPEADHHARRMRRRRRRCGSRSPCDAGPDNAHQRDDRECEPHGSCVDGVLRRRTVEEKVETGAAEGPTPWPRRPRRSRALRWVPTAVAHPTSPPTASPAAVAVPIAAGADCVAESTDSATPRSPTAATAPATTGPRPTVSDAATIATTMPRAAAVSGAWTTRSPSEASRPTN